MKYYLLLLISSTLVFYCCSKPSKSLSLHIDLPIEDSLHIQLFNLTTSEPVYDHSLSNTILELDSLKYGIYLLNLTWAREFISVDEFKRLRPTDINNDRQHLIQKLIFIDPKESTNIRLYTKGDYSQDDIENLLQDKNLFFEVDVDVLAGKSATLYESYETVLRECKWKFYQQKDSLKQVLYAYNDQGDFKEAGYINQQMKTWWEEKTIPEMLAAENKFLLANKDEIVTPFILMLRVTNAENYRNYKEVLDSLPAKFQKIESIKRLQSHHAGSNGNS